MWGAPSSPGWRHSATTWSQWFGDAQAANRRRRSGIARRVADYEDASALMRALAGIDDMVLISRGRSLTLDTCARSAAAIRKIIPSVQGCPGLKLQIGNLNYIHI